MSIRPIAAAGLASTALIAALAACAPTTYSPRTPIPAAAVFNENEFAWSQRGGQAGIEGRVDYRQNGVAFTCSGSAGLTPDTPYTRQRFAALYGSTDRAAVPAAVVRARTVADANANYVTYVRDTQCRAGRFQFDGLPDGGWFVIAPVKADGDPIVLMRHVQTRGGRVVALTL